MMAVRQVAIPEVSYAFIVVAEPLGPCPEYGGAQFQGDAPQFSSDA